MQEHLLDPSMGSAPCSPGGLINRPPTWPQTGLPPEATHLEANLVNGHDFPGGGIPGHPGFHSPEDISASCGSTNTTSGSTGASSAASKKSSSRRNAWGNLSYADLITQAIQSTPEKRLTLSQVYEWMVANIPYFKDKGDSNSSAGWKVSSYR